MWFKEHKFFVVWGLLVVISLSIFLFPNRGIDSISIITNLLFVTLFTISLFILLREKERKNKAIFLNFLLFFAIFIHLFSMPLIGVSLFKNSQFSAFYNFQYGSIFFHALLLFAITYLVIDTLFRQKKLIFKYLITFGVVVFAVSTYYGPFFTDAKYLYNHPDMKDLGVIASKYYKLNEETGMKPTVEEIAAQVELPVWKGGKPIGNLYTDEKIKRIEELSPYLAYNDNYLVLLSRPLYKANVLVNTFAILLIILFFGYQYKKDPPQGAYVEKIMFLFLILISLESLHSWAYVRSVDYTMFSEFFIVGQYLTIAVLSFLIIFFGLRLRFISSVQGEFYEHQLVSNPERISRWRDWVDNFILSYIFNSKTLVGRLLAPGRARR